MRLLSISSDPAVADSKSNTARQMVDYGGLFESIEVWALVREKRPSIELSDNVTVRVFSGRLLRFWRAFYWALGITKHSYDVITAQDTEHAFLAWLLAKKWGIPWQLQIHTSIFSPYFKYQRFTNFLRVIFAKFLIPRANCIRVVSERIKDSLKSKILNLESEIIVLPMFLDIERIKSIPVTVDLRKKYPDYDKVILVASRITKEKNIDLAIEAMQEIVKKYPKALLLIVGDGPEKKRLKAISHKLKTNIVFEPAAPFETLMSYLQTADLYVLSSNYEGNNRTINEASCLGCPIVSTDTGVSNEIRGISIVPVGDKEKLKEAIISQLENPQKPESPEQVPYQEYLGRYKKSLEVCSKSQSTNDANSTNDY